MLPVVLALTLLIGCGDDEKPAPAATEVVKKAPEKTPAQQLEEARKVALSGRHEEALALAEKVLARDPADPAVWRLLEQEALAAGQARGLLDRLDAARATGDQVGPHFLLRAELALSASMPEDARVAAKLAYAADPDAAAPLLARAALGLGAAGTPLAEPLPEKGAALLAWAQAEPEAAPPLLPAAEAVSGWRAALFRAQILEARGDLAGALAECAKAASDADPRAKIRANRARVELAARPEAGVSPADVGAWAGEVARAALAEGWGTAALEALERSVAALIAAGRTEEALSGARELQKALPAELEPAMLGRAGLAVASAASAAGLPLEAREAAAAAREKLGDAVDRVAEAAWIEGWSAWQLGRAAEIEAAAGHGDGQRKLALLGLAAMANGDLATAAASFPTTGLAPREGAQVWVEAAVADPAQARVWLERAVVAADQSGELGLRVQTRLALESWARASGDAKGAAAARAALAGLAPADAAGDALRGELAARALLEGAKVVIPAAEGQPAVLGAWSALSAGVAPPLAGDDPLAGGVSAWAEGRVAAVSGGVDAIFPAYSGALGKLPLHRQGLLSLGTALDGSQGLPGDADLAALTALGQGAPVDAFLAVHELSHRLLRFRREAAAGVDYTAALPAEKREPLRAAVARARAGLRSWLAGQGPYPKEALAAVQSAESALAKEDGFGPVLPVALESPSAQVESLGGLGIVSYRLGASGVHGVAISKRGSSVQNLGSTPKIIGMAMQLRSVLEAGAKGSGPSPVGPGDRLRAALLDPFADVLAGVGRYLVLAPEPLDAFPLTALPEQASGLRWLADIRNVGSLPSLGALALRTHTVETYNPDFLGFGAITAGAAAPLAEVAPAGGEGAATDAPLPAALSADELAASARVFPSGLKQTLVGAESKEAAWAERAKTARYLHFTALAPSPDGGFQLADGALTLSEIRATPLGAHLVVVSAGGTMAQQRLRAQAFLDAGAKAVLVSAWPVPDQARARFFGAYYEAIGRDRTPARAVSEAREVFLTDTLAGEGMGSPSVWGSFVLYGAP